ncbi:MAG: YdjY domain-containing protein [Nitrospira sp.]|nr:YdjY domain-containing protein [Nitrospira sp.]
MRRVPLLLFIAALVPSAPTLAYIEAPHSLGRCIHESSNIVLMEVTRVNVEKNLIIFRKVQDIKGKHPTDEIKHNIGKRGFHEREWKNVMAWAQVGKRAVFMYQGDASETCIGTYWYQCYREGDWWGMSHAEPFLLRTYYGDPDRLAELCTRILKGEEVIVTCLADGNKELLHQRKGKLQRMRASLRKLEYDPKRDFVGWGGDGDDFEEFKTTELLTASTGSWRYRSASEAGDLGRRWTETGFDDAPWAEGRAPLGYGEDEIGKRKGTIVPHKGQDYYFRRWVQIPAELLQQKGVVFRLSIASDDHAIVYINGSLVDQEDPAEDHEFAYWNREVDIPAKILKPGRNLIAAQVRNKPSSSDLYWDAELLALTPIVRARKPVASATGSGAAAKEQPLPKKVPEEPRDPDALVIDKANRTITLKAAIAPRRLPNLDQVYPIEVIATYPAPRGQKAHETVVTLRGIRPSDVHQALESIGLKPGKPAYGENSQAEGPVVKLFLEWTGSDGKPQRLPVEQCLVHRATGKTLDRLTWRFTGSARKQPDPEKDETVYGADLTGTFVSIFPVTDCCVLQSHLTMKDEPNFKLEMNAKVLPREGTAVKLILVAE